MKKKIVVVLLSCCLALSSASVAGAADFSDGSGGSVSSEAPDDISGALDDAVDVFSSGADTADTFSSQPIAEENAVEESDGEDINLASQSTYQISVSGELILSETQKFVDLLNAERAKLGRPPVQLDQEMMEIAMDRAIQGSVAFGHELPDGSDPRKKYDFAGECAAGSFKGTAEDFFEGWKNSAAHWSILTDTQRTRFGFAIYHHEGVDDYYYGYVNNDTDYHKPGGTLIPYTGSFGKQTINGFKMDIIPFYLRMHTDEKMEMKVNETQTLKAVFDCFDTYSNGVWEDEGYEFGDGALDNNNGTWESSDPSVATVDANGNVKALSAGTANIRFYVNGDRDKYYQNTVTVKKDEQGYWEYDQFYDETHYIDYETKVPIGGWIEIDGKLYHCVEYDSHFKFTYSKTTDGKEIGLSQGRLENLTVAIDGVWYKFDKNGVATKLNEKPDGGDTETAPGNPKIAGTTVKYGNQVTVTVQPGTGKANGYDFVIGKSSDFLKTGKYVLTKNNQTKKALTVTYFPKGTYYMAARSYRLDGGKKVYSSWSDVYKFEMKAVTPGTPKIQKCTAGKGTVKISYAKASGAYRYECVFTRKNFSSSTFSPSAKVKTFTNRKYGTISLKNIPKGTYYIGVRAYSMQGSTKVYGRWSVVKTTIK